MLNRLWAFLLIMICGFNALGVGGFASLSSGEEHESAFVASYSEAQQPASVSENDSIGSAAHFPGDGHKGDCDSGHKSHACHLGHCTFLLATSKDLVTPIKIVSFQGNPESFFLSVDRSGLSKPPRV